MEIEQFLEKDILHFLDERIEHGKAAAPDREEDYGLYITKDYYKELMNALENDELTRAKRFFDELKTYYFTLSKDSLERKKTYALLSKMYDAIREYVDMNGIRQSSFADPEFSSIAAQEKNRQQSPSVSPSVRLPVSSSVSSSEKAIVQSPTPSNPLSVPDTNLIAKIAQDTQSISKKISVVDQKIDSHILNQISESPIVRTSTNKSPTNKSPVTLSGGYQNRSIEPPKQEKPQKHIEKYFVKKYPLDQYPMDKVVAKRNVIPSSSASVTRPLIVPTAAPATATAPIVKPVSRSSTPDPTLSSQQQKLAHNLYEQGIYHMYHNSYEAASELFEKVVQLHPSSKHARIRLQECREALKNV